MKETEEENYTLCKSYLCSSKTSAKKKLKPVITSTDDVTPWETTAQLKRR